MSRPFSGSSPASPRTHAPLRRRWPRRIARVLLAMVVLAATTWGGLLLHFQLPGPALLRGVLVAAWCALGLATASVPFFRALRRRRVMLLPAFALGLVALLAGWSGLSPSHERDWADDVARLLEVEVDGDRVVLHNVRDFEWRSETDYTPRWETREYDLDALASADLVLSYWMGPHIAHTLVSFGFEDGRRVVFSLEIRKERGERFSALGGFFRRFEQVLVAADERDIIRTRSNARGEDVYLYRLDARPEALRAMFMGFVEQAGALRARPAFYNSLTSNCTTIVFKIARHVVPSLPLDLRLLASGHFAGYVYDLGGLTPGIAFEELHRRGHINARALAADAGTDGSTAAFSRAIRRGVPGVPAAEQAP